MPYLYSKIDSLSKNFETPSVRKLLKVYSVRKLLKVYTSLLLVYGTLLFVYFIGDYREEIVWRYSFFDCSGETPPNLPRLNKMKTI